MFHTSTPPRRWSALLLLAGSLAVTASAHADKHGPGTLGWVRHWNHLAIDASGLDHTPLAPGEARVFGEQLGPGRSSRAVAIAQIAVFEAVNAITQRYESYTGLPPAEPGTSMRAAIAQAAHDALCAMFPSQAAD